MSALEQLPASARAALDAAEIGVVLADAADRIVACNHAASEIVGELEGALIGRSISELLKTAGEIGGHDRSATSEAQLLRRDGKRVRVLIGAVNNIPELIGHTLYTLRDISIRRDVEDSLRDLDLRMRLMIEAAQDAIVTINDQSRVVDWNPAATSMFGWSRDEAIGSVLTDMIVPRQHRIAHHTGLLKHVAHGHMGILNRRIETTALHRDGREFDVELAVWPVKSGDRSTFTSFIRDISERKMAERALSQSEQRYRAVVENAGEGIIVTQEGYIRFANPRAHELIGYPAEVVARTPFIDMIHPDDRARVYGNYLRRMRGESVENNYEFRVVPLNGEVRWLQISAVAIDWDGRSATLNFLSDVTQSRNLKQQLQRTLAQQDAILETSVAGIMFIQQGAVVWLNPALECSLLGHSQGSMIGKPGESLFPDFAAWRRFVDSAVDALKSGRVFDSEVELQRANGELIWVRITGRALDVEDLPAGTIWNVIDVAQQRQAEAELKRALQRERELSELKSRVVAMTSHEFRTPLAAILSSVELLEDFGDSMPESERRDLTKLIKSALSRMNGMIEQVLFLGRADAEKLEFKPADESVRSFCEDVVSEVGSSVRARKIALSLSADRELIPIDANLMRHVLTNLLSNAIKYSPPDTVVRLDVNVSGTMIRLDVVDEGIGIAAHEVPRVFDTFFRARNAGTIAGTGLGLSIVKQCVDLQGGDISVQSELGRGTKVTVTLPLRSNAASPINADKPAQTPDA